VLATSETIEECSSYSWFYTFLALHLALGIPLEGASASTSYYALINIACSKIHTIQVKTPIWFVPCF